MTKTFFLPQNDRMTGKEKAAAAAVATVYLPCAVRAVKTLRCYNFRGSLKSQLARMEMATDYRYNCSGHMARASYV